MKHVINIFNDDSLKYQKDTHGVYASQSAQISSLWNTEKLGFHLEILEPKAFSCPYHFHHQEEELFIVLEGSATVREEGQFYQVHKGDLVIFKTGIAHQFYNHTDKPFKFFALSNKEKNEICEYPDSGKKWERQSKRLSQKGIEVNDYWKDEEHPEKFWPKK